MTAKVVRANEITGDSIIDDSIKGFKFNDIDVICIIDNNGNIEIEKPEMVKQILECDDDEIDIEELKDKYVLFKREISESHQTSTK